MNEEAKTHYRSWSLEDAVEVTLKNESDFLKVRETLTRIGIANYKDKKLYQTAHILHKKGRYYIIHFKGLFALDHRPAEFIIEDWKRQNTIAALLHQWNLVEIRSSLTEGDFLPVSKIAIINYKDKENWVLEAKYKNLGKNYRKVHTSPYVPEIG